MEHVMIKKLILTTALLLSSICFSAEPNITVKNAWVRATAGNKRVTAAYMDIQNISNESDVLYKVTSAQAGKTELHKVVVDNDNVMQMVQIDKIVIPAQETVHLAPKGLHIMLFKLEKLLKVGNEIELTLFFEKAGEIKLKLPAKSMASVHEKH